MNPKTSDFACRRLWLAVGLLGCGVIFVLSLLPNLSNPEVRHIDKVQHFAAYAVLGAWFGVLSAPRYVGVFIGLAVFGGLIEIVQAMTSYRSGDLWDLLADVLGIVAGLALARLGAMGWLRYIDARVTAERNHSR